LFAFDGPTTAQIEILKGYLPSGVTADMVPIWIKVAKSFSAELLDMLEVSWVNNTQMLRMLWLIPHSLQRNSASMLLVKINL